VSRILLSLLVAAVTSPLWLIGPASAECGVPRLSVTRAEVAVGEQITMTGTFWNDVCNKDFVDVGCEERPAVPPRPSQNVKLLLVDRDTHRGWEIAEVDADDDFGFKLKTAIDVSPGRYLVKAKGEKPHLHAVARFRVIER
jgi:hypothetical protein